MKVIGLDLSLTSTGVAVVTCGPGIEPTAAVTRISSKGKADADLEARYQRLLALQLQVIRHVDNAGERDFDTADLVVIEQPAYSRTTGHQHDRSGLWWLIVHRLKLDGIPVAEVAPSARPKYATGKGNAGKDEVLAAVVRRYPDVPVAGNDDADALVLAAMGARHLGHPIDDPLPVARLAAMDKVRWPDPREAA